MLVQPLLDPDAHHPDRGAIQAARDALIERFGEAPDVAIVLGSGLGAVVDALDAEGTAPYGQVGLPVATVKGHEGTLHVGTLGARRVALLAGRTHRYEGGPVDHVLRAPRVMAAWGVPQLVLTASVGSVHVGWPPSTLMRVTDHLDMGGANACLFGPAWGHRFPDPSALYNGPMGTAIAQAAERAGVRLESGVYAVCTGPAYETAAEIRRIRMLGGDVAGMSTVPEALAACALGVDVAAVAVVSNFATGVGQGEVDHASVTKVAGEAAGSLAALLVEALGA